MPIPQNLNLPDTEPKVTSLTLDNWKRGVITLIDKSRLPKDALEEAENIFLYEDGQPGPRPGVDWYGADLGGAIDGVGTFDTGSAVHLVVAAGGTIYRSTDNGDTWDTCTGATYTSGTKTNFNQYNNALYITNGVDVMMKYLGNTLALTTYTGLSTPTISSISENGLTGSTYTYYYKIAAVNDVGYTAASAAESQTVDKPRSDWAGDTTETIDLVLPAYQSGGGKDHKRYDIYFSEDSVNYYYLDSAVYPDLTYSDNGTAIIVPSTEAPDTDTTAGPLYAELTNVGARMYGARDPGNLQRIGYSSGSNPLGVFSNSYDGGYLDWQVGGKFSVKKVVDYRDGRGTPYATVFMDSSEGEGAVVQMSLEDVTLGGVTVTIPSAYKLPGSRGTPAPGSVVNVLNDYMFYNSQAFYNLGSRSQFLNLLSTDEISANIRPTVKKIKNSAEGNIASIYYDARVYFSVPYGTTTNGAVAIYDTERKAWLPNAFTIGFDQFLRYTDTAGTQKLLAYKNADTKLSEISSGIEGDYGSPFRTSLRTGLLSTTKNRFDFQFTEEGEIEFSNPQGAISINLIGIERRQGFSTISTPSITPTLTDTGWDSFAWDTTLWDDTSDAVAAFSESSIKRYFRVQKELNAVQWEIVTNSLGAHYVLRTLQTHGTDTLAGKPRTWKI